MKEEFFSKKVKFKRVLKSLGIALLIVIPITGLLYYYIQFVFIHSNNDSNVLGTENTYDTWLPEGYIRIEKSVSNPSYTIKEKSRVQETFKLKNSMTLVLQCPEVTEEDLVSYPSRPFCSISLNGNLIYDEIRSYIDCTDREDHRNCSQTISMVLYTNSSLNADYLFLSTLGSETIFHTYVYEIENNSVSKLSFPKEGSNFDNGGIYLVGDTFYMAFTDSSKQDFRIITYNYDNTGDQESYYSVWKVEGSNLILESTVKENEI